MEPVQIATLITVVISFLTMVLCVVSMWLDSRETKRLKELGEIYTNFFVARRSYYIEKAKYEQLKESQTRENNNELTQG